MRTTLASLVADWRQLGTDTAVVTHRGNRTLRTTYAELAGLTGRFAAELERRDIRPGERVLLWGENSAEWIAAFFGCLLRGVLAVPLDAAGSPHFAERVLAETSPLLRVGDPSLLALLPSEGASLSFGDFANTLPLQPCFDVSAAVTEGSPFQIVFTSGTTSEPKGVVHTHRNVLASLRPIEAEIGRYRRYERWIHPLRFLHTLPFSHVFGQFMGLWIPALLGAEVHLPPGVDPARTLALIGRERISVLVAVPRVLELLQVHLRNRFPYLKQQLEGSVGLPAWERWWRFRAIHRTFGFKFWAFICGGASLPADLESFWNGLGFALIQGYGMTETAALVTLNHPFKVGRGTLGKALPGREVRLSPEGEILVKGDMLAAGSWQGGRFRAREGEWLATGDLATQAADGALRFTGRRGDVIVTGAGMNVHPRDVEVALFRQPGVRACVVVGCDGVDGPQPVGVVLSLANDEALRLAMQQANAELSPYQQLRHLLRWPEPAFPHTSTGKLLRRQIADWACAQVSARRATDRSGVGADPLVRLVEEVTRQGIVDPDGANRLTEDLHLDSLGRVQLQSLLEQRFGVEIRDEDMSAMQTLEQLRQLTGLGIKERQSSDEAASVSLSASTVPSVPLNEAKTLPYSRWPWSAAVQGIRAVFLEVIAMPLVRLLAAPRLVLDEAVPIHQPMLLIANHVNTYDVPLILYALPGALRRRVATAMSAEVLLDMRAGREQGNAAANLLARPAYWLLLALFNVFPLPRSRGFRESFAHAGEALDRGYSVLVFPEGRRGGTGELQPFRPGIGLLVQASQVPVLPIALQGAGAASRSGDRWFRPRGLALHVGEPILFEQQETPEGITQQLEAALRALDPS